MKEAIGKGQIREDHAGLSAQLYAAYAKGREIRDLVAVVGEQSLTEEDPLYLDFAENFEERFLNQGWGSILIIIKLNCIVYIIKVQVYLEGINWFNTNA